MQLKINETLLNIFETGVENYQANRNNNRLSLIFLHYFGGSSESWQEVIEPL